MYDEDKLVPFDVASNRMLWLCLQVVSQHVTPGTLEGISLNVVDYGAIRYNYTDVRCKST